MSESVALAEPKRAWVKAVLGIEIAEAEPEGLRGRLNEIGLRLRGLVDGEQAAALRQRFGLAVAALKARDFGQVAQLLDAIEEPLAGALSGARGAEAKRVIGNAQAWREAVAAITGAVEGLKVAITTALIEEDELDPEELAEVQERMETEFATVTDALALGLASQVDAFVGADPAQQRQAAPKILAAIDQAEKDLLATEMVAILEENGLQEISIAAPARKALGELRDIVAAATA